MTQGDTNKEVAAVLVVTENTVKAHLRNIYRKLDVRNRQEFAAYAVQTGLVQDLETS